jgi:hypothetical protein
MELNITVADVKLSDYIDDDHEQTLADVIAEKIVHRMASTDEYRAIRGRVGEIRDEEIRKAVAPAIAEALNAPIHKTNTWGELVGGNTTLREHIVEVATKYMNAPADSYDRKKGTRLEREVCAQVEAVFKAEVAEAVKEAKAAVTGQLATMVADAVRDAMLRARA